MKTTEKYIFTFAKDQNGEDIPHRFMLTLSKRIKEVDTGIQKMLDMDGIDAFGMAGQYTMEVTLARTFDAHEIIAEIKKQLDLILSDIIRPTIVKP